VSEKPEPWWYWFGHHASTIFWWALGVAIGATLAVWTGAAKMQADLANLLGGILGAGLGAAGGVAGAYLLQEKRRHDDMIPDALPLLVAVEQIHTWIDMTARERGKAEEDFVFDLLDYQVRQMVPALKDPSPRLGLRTTRLVDELRERAVQFSEQYQRHGSQLEGADLENMRGAMGKLSISVDLLLPRLRRIVPTD